MAAKIFRLTEQFPSRRYFLLQICKIYLPVFAGMGAWCSNGRLQGKLKR